jgi:UDP-2,3-diacylglucosamine pyrophosphatase LpxH
MVIKDIFNYLWNGLIKEDKSVKGSKYKQMLNELPGLKNQEPALIHDQFSRYNRLNFYYIKFYMRLLEKWEKKRKYEYYLEGIKKFLKKHKKKLNKINHIIYGHSHNKKETKEEINNNEIKILNDGAWRHTEPHYIEIFSSDKIDLNNFPLTINSEPPPELI